jgi:serine/threonine protein kinase
MSQTADPRLGTTVGGYRIESMIGRGGMSVVYLAEDAHLGRKVALKFLAPDLVADGKFQERFVRESRLAASLEHPNIVTVYDAREADGQLYLAMRYVAGTDLKRLIESDGPLDPLRTVSIVSQTASALDAAHAEGLIHRDVKPGNILITPRTDPQGRDRVYLSDFGLTKRTTSDSGITATGQFVGTLDYAAPEQFEARPMDARADVYSLGGVLYECLTGEVPFPRENQAALVYAHLQSPPPKVTDRRPDLPPAINAVVGRAMAKDPGERYSSAGELATAAAEALGVTPVVPTTPSTPTSPVPIPPRRRTGILLGVGTAALAVVVLLVVLLNGRGSPPGAAGPSGAATPAFFVARVDPASGQIRARIAIPARPIGAAVGEGSVWVLSSKGLVDRIDPVTGRVTTIDGVAQDPRGIAAGEGAAWVANGTAGNVQRIDSGTNAVQTVVVNGVASDVAVGAGAIWIVTNDFITHLDPDTSDATEIPNPTAAFSFGGSISVSDRYAWIGFDLSGGFVSSVSVDSLQPAQRVDIGFGTQNIASDADGAWVAGCGTPGVISRVTNDGQSEDIAAGAAVCSAPGDGRSIAVAAGAEGVWVTDVVNGTVSRIQATTNQVETPIDVGKAPTALAVGLGSVWVAVDGNTS